ncbi:ABC transporter ATP-binding protein [Segniliparus rugosus]|uniref:ABC transporter n=1 Tax=Segniliparus rugosus (strain ATCC BAA-974 / DSM 45345 / CCUG 50838 / CIP 108380 / JCM 13579 / CDC 945) TaxID=679197 RepID=E5XNV6_SEGRC|nr:ABC transporter ATP-binding protein [Segniliparus rugosus]EFV13984.1 hypothetical protein HMPREF9336_01177 [Segniliparus rugosus ATCC BAA-974]
MIKKLFALADEQGRRRLRALIATVAVCGVLQGLAFVALVPFLTSLFTRDSAATARWLGVLALLAPLYAVGFWTSTKLSVASAVDVIAVLLDKLGSRLVELPLGWFAADRSGSVSDTATRGVVFAATVPYAILRPLLIGFITPATVLIGSVFLQWRVALVMALVVPVMLLVHRVISGRLASADREHTAATAETAARVIEYARVQPALRTAGDNAIARGLVQRALRAQHAATKKAYLTGGAAVGLFGGAVQLAVVAVIVVATWLALDGQLALATLVPLLVLAVRFVEPIVQSGALGGALGMAANTVDHIQSLIDEPALPEPDQPRSPQGWGIAFEDVTFGYDGDPVLRGLTFEAPEGAMTAIVGPSGSGKTTITRLIARFYDPEQGVVSIGGAPLPELGSNTVLSAVAPVFQDVYLFDGTILENIWLGNPEATREQVIRAGEQARADEIAARLPGGWDARVGEGGTNLSGGERQRVSIARALLKDAPIVLLDEATAALDVGNEQAIHDAFAAIREGRTLVVVAHRLQTIASADRIIMLDGRGGIAEAGSHEELLARGGGYARYWNERIGAAGWRLVKAEG